MFETDIFKTFTQDLTKPENKIKHYCDDANVLRPLRVSRRHDYSCLSVVVLTLKVTKVEQVTHVPPQDQTILCFYTVREMCAKRIVLPLFILLQFRLVFLEKSTTLLSHYEKSLRKSLQ